MLKHKFIHSKLKSVLLLLAVMFSALTCASKPRLTTHLADHSFTLEKARLYLNLSREGLVDSIAYIKDHKELTRSEGKFEIKSIAQKRALRVNWSRFLDHISLAQQVEDTFANYASYSDIKKKHTVFLVHYEAFLLSYQSAMSMLESLGNNRALDTILNEKSDWLGIPANSIAAVRLYYLNVELATRFAAYQAVNAYYSNKTGYALNNSMKKDQEYIWKMGKGKGVVMTLENGLKILQSWSKKMFFPTQKAISQMMGDIKVKRTHNYLITDRQIHKFQDKFQPGDIFLERREWYLSNIGLPGFWPHMALFVGTTEDRYKFFADDIEVKRWVQSKGIQSGNLEALLQLTYPDAYKSSLQIQKDGYLPRVIEAIGDGVSFTSLEYSAGADSVGVLRPRLDKVELARAIFVAFSYQGKPYDFDFDFLTDNEIVCSELIYKAYEPSPPFKGIKLPIVTMIGRKVSPPNLTVQLFDETFQTSNQRLEFVLFLDGYEKEEKAFVSNLKAFRNSWKRPKWHIFIQEKGK